VLLLLILIISLVSSVIAEESSVVSDVKKTGEKVQENTQGIEGAGDQVNKVLEGNVEIPSGFEFIASLFGISKAIELRFLIVLLCLWIVFFLIVHQVLKFTPFFGEGWQSWVGGVVITMIVAISGGFRESAYFFFRFGETLGVMRGSSLFQLLLSVVFILILFFALSKLSKMMSRAKKKAEMENTGETIARGVKSAEVLSKGVRKLSETS